MSPALYDLTRSQANHVGWRQAEAAGVARSTVQSLVDRGRLERTSSIHVLRLAGAAWTPMEPIWFALLAVGGDDVVVARHTAVRLLGIQPSPRTDAVHLLVPVRSFPELPTGIVLHRSDIIDRPWDVVERRGVFCTGPARTLCDMAREVAPGLLTGMSNDAVRRGLTDPVEVLAVATRIGRFRHKRRLLRIMDNLSPHASDAANATESKFLELVMDADLPLLGINVPLRDADGRQRYVDAVLRRPDGRHLPVEIDGHATHWTRIDRWHDERRERLLGDANPRLVDFHRIPADQIWHAPARMLANLRDALVQPSTVPEPTRSR